MSAHRRIRFDVRSLVLLAIAAVAAVTGAAPAQFGEAAGFSEIMMPYYLRRDLQLFEDGLQLDDAQAAIVESLYFDYEQSQEESRLQMMERFAGMKDEIEGKGQTEIMELVFRPFQEKAEEWEDLNQTFLLSIQAILTPDQDERWGSFQRELRRQKELPNGKYAGEKLDLVELLGSLPLDDTLRRDVEPLLEEYEIGLDDALRKRAEIMRGARLPMMKAIQDNDINRSLELYERQIAARVAVRDINDYHAAVIAEELPMELRDSFLEDVRNRSYPRVYGRKTSAHRLMLAALELDDLSTEMQEALTELSTTYFIELDAINEKIVALVREHEPNDDRYRARAYAARARGETPTRPEDPSRDAFRERQKMDAQYVALLREMLPDELFNGLPGASRFKDRAAPGEAVGLPTTGEDPAAIDLNAGAARAGGKSSGGKGGKGGPR